MKEMADEIRAWEQERNSTGATVRGTFSKDNARIKLQRHYSNIQN